MEKIIVAANVGRKISTLVSILYKKEYFSILENAIAYVNAIENFIYTIPKQQQYPTRNPKYGQYYCKFQPNKRTTWYITFDTDGETYLVKNVMNNHTREYPTYIRDIK